LDFREQASRTAQASTAKEAKVVPNLIMWLEKFDADIIKLSSTTEVPLIKYLKRSTARDFKIYTDKLVELRVKSETSAKKAPDSAKKQKKRKQPDDASRVNEAGEEEMAVDNNTAAPAAQPAKSKRPKS
jgi:Fanconi anemia group I protein